MAHLVLVRGLPRSGKSTFAKSRYPNYSHYEADDYMRDADGKYVFDATKLPEAHTETRRKTIEDLKNGKNVVVSNTFSQNWEIELYRTSIPEDTTLWIIHLNTPLEECLTRTNEQNCPDENLVRMWRRWEAVDGEQIMEVN